MIRSGRRPRQRRLQAVYDALTASGATVTRRGIPTFVCEDARGLYVVWVKRHPGSRFRIEQHALAAALRAGGVRTFRAHGDGSVMEIGA